MRSIVLFYRECAELLRAAGAEHRNAVVVNVASMAGKSPQPFLSVYAATKSAVIAYTQAMNKELNDAGIKSVAFCPGFVDTDMSDFIKEAIPPGEMLRTSDIAAGLRFVLRALAELRDPGDHLPAPGRGHLNDDGPPPGRAVGAWSARRGEGRAPTSWGARP